MKSRYLTEIVFVPENLESDLSKAHLKTLCGELFKKFTKHHAVKRAKSKKGEADLTLVFVRRAKMKSLNKTYRNKDYATDILSFAPEEEGAGLGELIMCEAVLKKQGRDHGLSLQDEVDSMVIHGFLHLLGYDHEKSRKEELKMMALQDKLWTLLTKK